MPPPPTPVRKRRRPWGLGIILIVIICAVAGWFVMAHRPMPEKITYGVSFSTLHADELNLDWKETYHAILDDLGVRKLRLMAHWNRIEPRNGVYDFSALDYQMLEAEKRNAEVILAIGRKVPGWPECHVPEWAAALPREEMEQELFDYMRMVVERYKDSPALKIWQVENEPFLHYALEYCDGSIEAEDFVKDEIAFVRFVDPTHPIMVSDSGEFGRWYQAHRIADVFATSMYLYIYYDGIGYFRYPIGPSFFRVKRNIVEQLNGVRKPMILSELSAEPWLTQPIVETPVDFQLERMGIDKFREMISFARETGFDEQYLWGAEWWYWLKKEHGLSAHWDEARMLFPQNATQ